MQSNDKALLNAKFCQLFDLFPGWFLKTKDRKKKEKKKERKKEIKKERKLERNKKVLNDYI